MRCALVTGVQTCALPISEAELAAEAENDLDEGDEQPKSEAEEGDVEGDLDEEGDSADDEDVDSDGDDVDEKDLDDEDDDGDDAEIGRESCRERVCRYV